MDTVELFSGAGGLALGLANAGFNHKAVIEWNGDACDTIRENISRKVDRVRDWNVFQEDISAFDYSGIKSAGIDVISGGPPCQPFSIGGKHKGKDDNRNMFPHAVRAIRELEPRAFIFENVKGLLRPSFVTYFEYIILQLTYPCLVRKDDEDWDDHLRRLEQCHTKGGYSDLNYRVVFNLLNAVDYGVPQKQERVFMVGFRSDLKTEWSFPPATHSQDELSRSKWINGEYWEEHEVPKKERPEIPEELKAKLKKLSCQNQDWFETAIERWRTVRDAIKGLPDPRIDEESDGILNHKFQPGAKSYPGHTGSPLDEPAKVLKAGDHGVPGGENMLRYPDDSVRYFTVRESARLQTFPDHYVIKGSWTESMRQLGNAVPVKLAEVVGKSILAQLKKID